MTRSLAKAVVYILKAHRFYKIGQSKMPMKRMRDLQTAMPIRVSLIMVIDRGDARDLEAELHERFLDRQTRGEWFLLTDADLEAIRADYPTESYRSLLDKNQSAVSPRSLPTTWTISRTRKKGCRINLVMDRLTVNELRKISRQTGAALSELIRRAVREFIERRKVKP